MRTIKTVLIERQCVASGQAAQLVRSAQRSFLTAFLLAACPRIRYHPTTILTPKIFVNDPNTMFGTDTISCGVHNFVAFALPASAFHGLTFLIITSSCLNLDTAASLLARSCGWMTNALEARSRQFCSVTRTNASVFCSGNLGNDRL